MTPASGDGVIDVAADGLPAGVTVKGASIGPGQNAAKIALGLLLAGEVLARGLLFTTGTLGEGAVIDLVLEASEKDEDDEERAAKLPKVEKGEQLKLNSITPDQHFTDPPPRYTEATLVKELEKKGIGRPSTYSAILSTIQKRGYVKKDGLKRVKADRAIFVVRLQHQK